MKLNLVERRWGIDEGRQTEVAIFTLIKMQHSIFSHVSDRVEGISTHHLDDLEFMEMGWVFLAVLFKY
ncbi:hypothetical protein V6Z11_D01G196400 [Gossypium hirsutum]